MHLPPPSIRYVGFASVVLAAAVLIGVVATSSHAPIDQGLWMRCPNGDPEPDTVDARCVAEGQYVHQGDVIADFRTPAELHAVVQAPEDLFGVLRAGPTALMATLHRERLIVRANNDGIVSRLRGARPLSYDGYPTVVVVLTEPDDR